MSTKLFARGYRSVKYLSAFDVDVAESERGLLRFEAADSRKTTDVAQSAFLTVWLSKFLDFIQSP
jgi:hypothetical protein